MTTIGKFICALAMILSFVACTKNELKITGGTVVSNANAQAKIFFVSAYRANPTYQININDVRVSNLLGGGTNPTPFPGGGLNTGGLSTSDYLDVSTGSQKISFVIPKYNTNIDSVTLASSSVAFEAGKKFSLYVTDTASSTSFVMVEDSLVRTDSGFAKYKFVNLVPDGGAVDLYVGTVMVASNIAYKGVSPSFILPISNTSSTWSIRATGTTTTIGGGSGAQASSLGNQRVYTVIARGYRSITTTTDPRYAKISLIFNQ